MLPIQISHPMPVKAHPEAPPRPDKARPSINLTRKRKFDPAIHCGAQLRFRPRGEFCTQPKGCRTPHLGSGKCWLHGGMTPIKHGLESLIKQGRLKDTLKKMSQIEHDILDLTPEVKLMRALVIDFVNRYDTFVDALETWYNALDLKQKNAGLPPVHRTVPTLEDAGHLLEAVSRIIERMHKVTREGSVSLDVFRGLMAQMGLVVAKHVTDGYMLDAIERDWSMILVNPKSFVKGSTAMPHLENDDPVVGPAMKQKRLNDRASRQIIDVTE